MKRVVILSNHHAYTYNFRKEIIYELINQNFKVYIVVPYGDKVELLKDMGCEVIDIKLDRRGVNPLKDLKLLLDYYKIIKIIKPDVVLTYTVKPNIYGGIACRMLKVPFIANVTGLGSAIENKGVIRKVLVQLYRVAFKRVSCIFFQNIGNQNFFLKNKIGMGRHRVIPGSGVNLKEHYFEEYPENDGLIRFLFIGRIMRDKGIEELIESATEIKSKYNNIKFDAIGFCENDYKERAIELEKLGIINFYGVKDNVHTFIKNSNVVVLPSYHEGMANVLLEAASTGRPVLASNIPGCIETFDEGVSGFGFEVRNSEDLSRTLIKFINLPYEEKRNMGVAGRRKMEKDFDRRIIVKAYLEEINRLINK